MSIAGGGPAAHADGGVDSGGSSARSRCTPQTRARQLRATFALARIEASLLVRSALVLGGLLAGAGVVWAVTDNVRPVWWEAGWRIGYGQMVLSMSVLVATHLAAGRVWRDDLQDLYASFPSPVGTRTRAQLLGALGALPASLLMIAAAVAAFELRGAIGTPGPAVLVGGLVLVLAGALIGVAVGARFPHPLAGVLAALVWFGAFSQTNRFNRGIQWLMPWSFNTLGGLPSPLVDYPPAAAHDIELAGIAALATTIALALTAKGLLQRTGLLGAGAVALAVACLAGVVQLRPVPTAALDHLAEEVATPAVVQHCTTTDGVQYCVYPGFGSLLPELRGPVSGVLAHLPTRPAQPLKVQQVASVTFDDPTLTYGHSTQQINAWLTRTRTAPVNAPAADAIYPVVGKWPAGGALGAARFDVALATAEWAVGLAPTTGNHPGPASSQCLPVDQAREAIAIWLTLRATHPSTASLQDGLPVQGGPGSYVLVGDRPVATWIYPGEYGGYLASPGPQTTADGYLLAHAMTALSVQQVQQVLDHNWAHWLNPDTNAAELAAALGIPRPTFPVPGPIAAHPPPGPGQPVCT